MEVLNNLSGDSAIFRRLNSCTSVDLIAKGVSGYLELVRQCMDVIDSHPLGHFIAICTRININGMSLGYCPVRLYTLDSFTDIADIRLLREWVECDGLQPLQMEVSPTTSSVFTYPEGQYNVSGGMFLPRRFENIEFYEYASFTLWQRVLKMQQTK